jgi:hypothetical protein
VDLGKSKKKQRMQKRKRVLACVKNKVIVDTRFFFGAIYHAETRLFGVDDPAKTMETVWITRDAEALMLTLLAPPTQKLPLTESPFIPSTAARAL